MRFMSFNTQHCLNYRTRRIDFSVMADAITSCGADVVGLNEMRGCGTDAEYEAQVERLADLTGMPYFYFAKAIDVGDKGPYGNGILSKIPLVSAQTVMIPDPVGRREGCRYETRCVLRAELSGGVTVLVTHMGLNPDERESAVETVLGELLPQGCVLMGDFNTTPDDDVLLPIRARMTDTAIRCVGETKSFPSDAPKSKIDYIFVTPDLDVVSASVPAIVASDHRPHLADIAL